MGAVSLQTDPDMLTGYEMQNKGLGYVKDRATSAYDMNLMRVISRVPKHMSRFETMDDQYGVRLPAHGPPEVQPDYSKEFYTQAHIPSALIPGAVAYGENDGPCTLHPSFNSTGDDGRRWGCRARPHERPARGGPRGAQPVAHDA